MPEERDITGIGLKFGTFEDAKKEIGKKTPREKGRNPANRPMIELFNAAVENPDPRYWDEAYAKEKVGGIMVPPAMLMTMGMPAFWAPEQFKEKQPSGMIDIPLPGDTVINVSTETEFLKPVIVGDQISSQEEVVDISLEKKTRIGIGHFITTASNYYNQRGELVAVNKNTLYRYKAGTGG